MKNDYRGLIRSGRLRAVIDELRAQGMTRPTLRSCYYLLLDRRDIASGEHVYKKLDEAVSKERDKDGFPYGLLAPEGGTKTRGLLPDELEDRIRRLREKNIPPVLCDGGKLTVLLIEKAGLVDYLRAAVGGRVPVASPGGMVRKEWAVEWLGDVLSLAEHMTGKREVRIVYLGDRDVGGGAIVRESERWYPRWQGVTFERYAVTEDQLARLNQERGLSLRELHIDGYIALRGPQVFAQEIRDYLGLEAMR